MREEHERRVDIDAGLLVETPRAYRICDGKRSEWVPKSQCERNYDGTFTMPEWLAIEKGFV